MKTEGGRRRSVAPSANTAATRSSKRLGIAFTVGAMLLLAAAGWGTSLDSTCALCHSEHTAALDSTAHTHVSCYDCHVESAWKLPERKAAELFRMYPRALGGVRLDGPGQPLSRTGCTKCHDNGPAGTLESGGLRINHEACAGEPGRCGDCHGGVAHGDVVRWSRTPVMDDCLACHDEYGASLECDTCHDGKLELQRLASGPWQVTHGPNWQATHGMGNLGTCTACHEPAKCVGCHNTEVPHPEAYLNTHGKDAVKPDAKCLDCHRTKGWCTSCHGVEMPHPNGFLPRHSEAAEGYNDPVCHACHAPADCRNCHVSHVHPGLSPEWLEQLRGTTK